MDNEMIFSVASGIAMLGWVLLIALPKPWRFRIPLAGVVTILALFYAVLVIPTLGEIDFMDFNTLAGVMNLMGSEEAMLVGWIHYLTFDLLAGCLIARDADRIGLSRWLILPALFFTFMLGPIGWVLYLIMRVLARRNLLVGE